MDCNFEYRCKYCSSLMFKTSKPITNVTVEIVCRKSDCKKKQLAEIPDKKTQPKNERFSHKIEKK